MKKRKTSLVVALIVMGVALLGLAAGVYAKYIASITGTGTATVAKWAFSTENTNSSVSCPVPSTYTAATLVNGKIAPGTEGECTIALKNAQSEVGVSYTIKLSNIANQPTNLKYYKTRSGSAGNYTYSNELTATSGSVTGTLNAGDSTGTTVTIYWVWPYETGAAVSSGAIVDNQKEGDAADTTNGESANTTTITFDIQGVQVQPATN